MYGFSAILCLVILVVPGWTSERKEFPTSSNSSSDNCSGSYHSNPVKCCESSAGKEASEKSSKLFIINRSSITMCCSSPMCNNEDNTTSVADPPTCPSENTDGEFSESRKYHFTKKLDTTLAKRASSAFELQSCQGEDLIFYCNITKGHKIQVSWKKEGDVGVFSTKRCLTIQNVQRESGGLYSCEMIDPMKIIVRKRFRLTIQFPPTVTVPKLPANSTAAEEHQFLCKSESNPPAEITWLKNSVPVNESQSSHYVITSEVENCVTMSFLRVQDFDNSTSNKILEGNFTCQARNSHGVASFTQNLNSVLPGSEGSAVEVEEKRKFNVSGFIIGMLPPLFISFYIILKLGYRSRYAEERGEDDGVREEPFFISY